MSESNGEAKDLVKSTLPPWLAKMREAAQAAVSEDDVKAIVQAQVEKAKAGDHSARDFIFNHVLGGTQLKGATFVQNNYHEPSPPPPPPAPREPGPPPKPHTPPRNPFK